MSISDAKLRGWLRLVAVPILSELHHNMPGYHFRKEQGQIPTRIALIRRREIALVRWMTMLRLLGRVLINASGPDIRLRGIIGHRKAALNRSKMTRSGHRSDRNLASQQAAAPRCVALLGAEPLGYHAGAARVPFPLVPDG